MFVQRVRQCEPPFHEKERARASEESRARGRCCRTMGRPECNISKGMTIIFKNTQERAPSMGDKSHCRQIKINKKAAEKGSKLLRNLREGKAEKIILYFRYTAKSFT